MNRKNQKGVILLLTLLILSGVLAVTLTAADLVLAGIRMNRLAGYSGLAYFAAEAGLERALYTARQPGFSYPSENQEDFFNCAPSCSLANGSAYQVDYFTSPPSVTFKSVGDFSGAKRSVESTYEIE